MANLAGKTLDSADFWWENAGGSWAIAIVLLHLLAWKLLAAFKRRRDLRSSDSSSNSNPNPTPNPNLSNGASGIISDTDLGELMRELDVKNQEKEIWEDVIDKNNGFISYIAKCCRPQDGPLKYLSVTIFEKCSTELLRDFYMDNEYSKE